MVNSDICIICWEYLSALFFTAAVINSGGDSIFAKVYLPSNFFSFSQIIDFSFPNLLYLLTQLKVS